MKQLFLAVLLVSAAITIYRPARSQNAADRESMERRLKLLRTVLDVAATMPINISKHGSLSRTSPLKVFVSTGFVRDRKLYSDRQVYDNFRRWLNEWNQKEGKTVGPLVLVTDIAQSDLIIVRFADTDLAAREARKFNDASIYVPFFGYIINRNEDSLEIVSYWAQDLPGESDKESGEWLRDRLIKLMKHRDKTNSKGPD